MPRWVSCPSQWWNHPTVTWQLGFCYGRNCTGTIAVSWHCHTWMECNRQNVCCERGRGWQPTVTTHTLVFLGWAANSCEVFFAKLNWLLKLRRQVSARQWVSTPNDKINAPVYRWIQSRAIRSLLGSAPTNPPPVGVLLRAIKCSRLRPAPGLIYSLSGKMSWLLERLQEHSFMCSLTVETDLIWRPGEENFLSAHREQIKSRSVLHAVDMIFNQLPDLWKTLHINASLCVREQPTYRTTQHKSQPNSPAAASAQTAVKLWDCMSAN